MLTPVFRAAEDQKTAGIQHQLTSNSGKATKQGTATSQATCIVSKMIKLSTHPHLLFPPERAELSASQDRRICRSRPRVYILYSTVPRRNASAAKQNKRNGSSIPHQQSARMHTYSNRRHLRANQSSVQCRKSRPPFLPCCTVPCY